MIDSWVLYQQEPKTTVQTSLPPITKLHFNTVAGSGDSIFSHVSDAEMRNSRALKKQLTFVWKQTQIIFQEGLCLKTSRTSCNLRIYGNNVQSANQIELSHLSKFSQSFQCSSSKTKINWISMNKSISSCFSWQGEVLPTFLHWQEKEKWDFSIQHHKECCSIIYFLQGELSFLTGNLCIWSDTLEIKNSLYVARVHHSTSAYIIYYSWLMYLL